MLPVSSLIRRSTLVVPVLDREAVDSCWRHNADAIVLDASDAYADDDKPAARAKLREAVASARRGGAEVFARVSTQLAYADIAAAACPGLTGILLSGAESAGDVAMAAEVLGERERVEGIPVGKLDLFLLLDSARAVWRVRELVNASPRLSAVALDEPSLHRSLGITPSDDFDTLAFCRGRVIVETLAVTRLPIGIGHPLGARPRELDGQELLRLANQSRNIGFKGALCPFPSWVGLCNQAFSPNEDQIAHYREIRAAFAEGVARGTAAVPFGSGQMIDVPVDERAKLTIDLWERCRRRDAEKAAALAAHRV
jgi:citrate lyase subunit beta / citryl-CoA lyase